MCRLLAYVGQTPLVLSALLEAPPNSLINQSKGSAGDGGVNADGVGVVWYDHSIDALPGMYKSTQPAWNDFNLKNIIPKVKSRCFLGHLRAATISDISIRNCHPFLYRQFAFMHNGGIRQFEQIRRTLLKELDDEHFKIIHGYTDSEHFFALLMQHFLPTGKATGSVEEMAQAFGAAARQVTHWQKALPGAMVLSKLNTVLTDGQSLLATHYVTDPAKDTLSLIYTPVETIAESLNLRLNKSEAAGVIVASEPLCGEPSNWQAVPVNHMLLVQPDFKVRVQPIQ